MEQGNRNAPAHPVTTGSADLMTGAMAGIDEPPRASFAKHVLWICRRLRKRVRRLLRTMKELHVRSRAGTQWLFGIKQ